MEGSRYKILLIEDDVLDQKAFMRMVKESRLSYDCTVVGSVSEVCDIADFEQFDVIISDYSLGDGTAFDILKLVKNIPIILVTGAGNEEVAAKAWRAGVYDYLIKDHERNYLKTIPIAIKNAVGHEKTEGELRLLSRAIISTNDCVYITDLEGKITFVNKAFCETYGYEKKEVIGKDSNILWKENPSATDSASSYEAFSDWEVGFFHKHKDGSEFPVSLTRSAVKNENGNEVALVVIAHDISEHIEIENEFRMQNQDLEKRNRLKKELAAAFCHELTMLTDEFKDIISNAMTGASGEISSKLHSDLELAEKNIERTGEVIRNFLEILQIDTSEMKTIESAGK